MDSIDTSAVAAVGEAEVEDATPPSESDARASLPAISRPPLDGDGILANPRQVALLASAVAICLLAWRFYLTGDAGMDLAGLSGGWEAYARGASPYSAHFGVDYPPAMQWIGGTLMRLFGRVPTLVVAQSAMAAGCVALLWVSVRCAGAPVWVIPLLGCSFAPLLYGLQLGNPGPGITGMSVLGLWLRDRRRTFAAILVGVGLALKPLFAPAMVALLITGEIRFVVSCGIVALATTLPAITLTSEWIHRLHEWMPEWANARKDNWAVLGWLWKHGVRIPPLAFLLAIGTLLGWAGRRSTRCRKADVLAAGSTLGLPIVWLHGLTMLLPLGLSLVTYLFEAGKRRT